MNDQLTSVSPAAQTEGADDEDSFSLCFILCPLFYRLQGRRLHDQRTKYTIKL